MKLLFFLSLFASVVFGSSSCCSHKDLPVSFAYNCQGIVHLSENGCPIYIEITNSQVEGINVGNKIYPVDLADKYKKKGLKLEFFATISRAQSPEGCSIDGVAAIGSVNAIP
jgi:hypothetical protein